jgi:alpha-beta hydrolase superfamily lysophospholipase
MERKQWMRPASSGREEIFSQRWVPEKPKAILQIAHGMAEYSDRYDEFACYLADRGYLVCANDHAGHGRHAKVKGFFAEQDGWEYLLKDMNALMDEVAADYEGLPCFLLGHSMGSFLARSYITRFGGLRGVILSGTMGCRSGMGLGRSLATIQKKCKGPQSLGKLISAIAFGANNKRIKNPVNLFAWLCTVDEVCVAYRNDPYCGFNFTAGAFYDLFSGMIEITSADWAGKVPKDLPIYVFSGEEDPVGAYGKGPTQVFEQLKSTGHEDVSLKLYSGGRHEMLNESNKEEAYADTFRWLEDHMG